MADLFDREQRILDNAERHLKNVQNGTPCSAGEFAVIVDEYSRLLKQLRMITKLHDKTTVDLNKSNLDLLGKVHYDALTGIYNRRYMEEGLRRIIKTMRRSGSGMLSVLMIDIDFFKKYNDTYGHSKGDDCLKTVARTLKQSLKREDDFVARYGGEEFIAVLPHTGEEGACKIAERLLANIEECNIPHEKNEVADCVTISIGATSGDVVVEQNGKAYINRADMALYISKHSGRNRYTFMNL